MKEVTRTFYAQVVMRAVDDVIDSLDSALDLSALAKRAALSPLHFHRIFKGLLGETPLELHRRLRLERAAQTLLDSEVPVTRIAFEAGYETHESFTRAFRDAYDASPSEFRSEGRARALPWAAATSVMLATPSGIHYGRRPKPQFLLASERSLTMQVQIQSYPRKRVFVVPHQGPYTTISEAFGKLDAIVRPAGLLERGGLEMVALYYDDPEVTPVAELRSDAGLVVDAEARLPAGLKEVEIPEGDYARTLHKGPYQTLGDTWARFMGGWLVESGRRVGTGPMYERYLNTPMDTAPENLETELLLSLE